MNNLVMRNLFGQDVITYDPQDKSQILDINYELVKFRVFDSIYRSLFKVNGVREVVLAVDDKNSWRKLYWSRYKSHRKDNREKIMLDWNEFYRVFEEIMTELKENFPFKVIKIANCEADDIIGVLVLEKPQDFYLISTDKDFLQLSSPRCKIYNPLKKVLVDHPNPELFLVEQSLCGQAKDNIYNIKTPTDWPEDKRKPGFGEKAWEKVLAYGVDKWLEENNLRQRYEENRNLMDFARIPAEIKRRVLRDYDGYVKPNPEKIYDFFKTNPWPEYVENFTNVENTIMQLY
jgi:hypothetical protein